jgi:hypothetical protein
VESTHVSLVLGQPSDSALDELVKHVQPWDLVVAKWKSSYPSIKYTFWIASSWFGAKIKHVIVLSVLGLQKTSDSVPWIPVHVLNASSRKSMCYDTRADVSQINAESILFKTILVRRNTTTTSLAEGSTLAAEGAAKAAIGRFNPPSIPTTAIGNVSVVVP